MNGELKITYGYNGWGNRKVGTEAYGPGGRWSQHPERKTEPDDGRGGGDLLGDHLDELGCHEGSPFIVIASTSRFDTDILQVLATDDFLREAVAVYIRGLLS